MGIKAEEISSIIRDQIENYGFSTKTGETGYVISAGDGIARIYGLKDCMSGEMLAFDNDVYGMAINLEEDNIGCVLLDSGMGIKEGSQVNRTGKMISVPTGEAMVGRVVDPLGRPIDGKGEIKCDSMRPVEFLAPGVINRKSVSVPLQTGIVAVDSMIPIGRGQRELIIGDRQTGKTSIAVDTIINQKGTGVICVYVAIGQKASTVAGIVETLERHGAMEHTIIVLASASDPASLLYIAPYAGCAMAEYFMYEQHRDALVIYDDLSKHAVAYREMSLLLRRPPGREAYPGDVFYLHSRLLERAARLSDEIGGGSITALPIIETQAGDFSAYIPTNVISITDGQIYLQSDLFYAGIRPAVNVGISVSRVGGSAQTKAMKKVAGSLRMDLAQFRELEVFAQFGSDLDKVTLDKLTRGARLVETLKQPLNSPLSMEDQAIVLYVANGQSLMTLPINQVRKFTSEFLKHLHEKYPEIPASIRDKGKFEDDVEAKLKDVVAAFAEKWRP